MADHWKSTPTYWCKFCKTYVRDTTLEKKNHEATPKHQNNIQKSLRELHKGKERENREAQRAKDEVARLNALVGGKDGKSTVSAGQDTGPKPKSVAPAPPVLSKEAQRKAHAEQLVALGVQLPDELKREVTGVGAWQVVSQTVVEQPLSLADIKNETGEDSKDGIKNNVGGVESSRGIHKRKADEDEDEEEFQTKRKAWGSKLRTYPGANSNTNGDEDLDSLLSGIGKKSAPDIKAEPDVIKREDSGSADVPLDAVPVGTSSAQGNEAAEEVKQEEDAAGTSVPAVLFKKRKKK